METMTSRASRYPWELLPTLISDLEHHRKKEAHQNLDMLLGIFWKESRGKLPVCKLRCAPVTSYCARAALQAGVSSEIMLQQQLELLDELASVRSWQRVCLLMHRYLDRLLKRIRPMQGSSIERTVGKIRQTMRTAMSFAPSLAEQAAASGLSVGYLSRSFSTVSGKSYREEKRAVRMETARKLLIHTNLKITTIASEVGLRDPSQFIADFRKEFGITPGKYRTKNAAHPVVGLPS